MAVYSIGSQLEWREVEGGPKRYGLRATFIGEILFVYGGNNYNDYFTSILSWDPVAESWLPAGDLNKARSSHAAVAVPASLVKCKV